jgi:hypothetical protein
LLTCLGSEMDICALWTHENVFEGEQIVLGCTRVAFLSRRIHAGQIDLLNCEYDPPTQFDQPELLKKLYGRQFHPNDQSGHGNVVVLGAHNSGTSMVTRLIMLLGAFAGNFETISIHRHNKLKYYEQFAVSLFHDAFLGKFVDTRFRPYHGQGLNFTTITDADKEKLDVCTSLPAELL